MSAHPSPRRLSRRAFLAGSAGVALLLPGIAGAQDRRVAAAPLPSPHAFHTTTLLQDGTVLVTGGRDGQITLDTTARYDPATDRWMPTAPLPEPRAQHSSILLADGRVFVVGNYQVGLTSAVIYDPAIDQWATVAPLPTPYGPAGAAFLPGGQVLALTCDPQRYDPTSDRWFAAGTLPASGVCTLGSALCTLVDGRVLATGGPYRGGGYNTAIVYDATTDTWTMLPPMQHGRAFHTATALPDNGALIVGGMDLPGIVTSAERYDAARNQWTTVAPPRLARSGHTATLLNDGSVLVVGGVGDRGDIAPATIAERYDPATNRWSDAGSTHPFIRGHAAVLLDTGDVLVTGGTDDPAMPTRAGTYTARFLAPPTGLGLVAR